MLAALSPTNVLVIAAPLAFVLFVLVVVLYASQRTRSSVATHLERGASKRERERSRAARRLETGDDDHEPTEAELVPVGVAASAEPGTALAVPESGPPESVRAQLEQATKARLVAPPMPYRDPERAELDRRQFLNKGIISFFGLYLGIFGVASIAFLYPKLGRGFGGKVNGGKAQDAIDYYKTNKTPLYNPEGRFYMVPFIVSSQNEGLAKKVYALTYESAKQAGVMVIYQKCAHLGCRVPWCQPSEWFECPCHGSQYNVLGERQGGPAPRGLSRFQFSVTGGGEIVADTGTPVDAPPTGINTPGLPPPPSHCV